MSTIIWEQLYATEAPRLLGLCRRYVQDPALAQDLMHDAFVAAISKQDTYKAGGPVAAWLRKITLNTVLLHLRKEKRLLELARNEPPYTIEETASGPDESLHGRLLDAGFDTADLLDALDRLPAHHRVVFNLYVMEGYTHRQIADTLGISAGTSKSHLARARRKIQELLLEKVNAMPKKERRAAVFFLPFFKKTEAHPVDALYKDKLSGLELPTDGQLPEHLAASLRQAPPPVVATGLGPGAKVVLGFALASGLGGLWWLSARPAPGDAAAGKVETGVLAPPAEPAPEPQNPGGGYSFQRQPDPAPAAAPRPADKAAPATRKAAAPGEPEAPAVVVRRQVVQKDTVFRFKAPDE
ncbi:MAG: RNA polymerase sigma factor [Saprospiraceae bacterium]